MKEVLHKISSILMALLVLFSSFSFTVHKHICGGEIADVSYILQADSCGMEMNDCANDNSSQRSFEKESCCNDISEVIEGNQNEQQALQSLELEQIQFVTLFVDSYINLFKEANTPTFNKEYAPPIVVKDIYKLDEVFLI